MKLISKRLEKDGTGSITLRAEEAEDLWHVYNLVSKGDLFTTTTMRKVQKETSTGSIENERVRLRLTIEVDSVDFDPGSEVIRFMGRNVSETPFVKMGAFHTLELEVKKESKKDFTITKKAEEGGWDSVALETVETACDPAATADVAAVIMNEGLANICLITSTMTIVRSRIEMTIPRKRKGSSATHDKALEKFFESVLRAILQYVNFDVVKAVIVASPGFTKDQFFQYLSNEMVKQDNKILLQNKSKFLLAHSNTPHKHGLKEVLTDNAVAAKLVDTKAASEVRALGEFYEMLKVDPDRAFYGVAHVMAANERSAIQTLLITDSLFRAADIATRKKYVSLVESVKEGGGDVRIFSTQHVSGEQLQSLGGIAAILRFGLPDIEDQHP
eukprot:TRINITY_DN15714_c0_g1_i1.p1 TRINITY_DN15714_c0_g1~~TRINITY_DN15714_c0_g1_i1.p1  ORF type:complete len:387 (+),score=71.03 TRINITY_DN15714_c0_g1_i1:108-1268(+)